MSTMPTPSDHFVEINGLNIHYVDWGGNSNRNLLLAHGREATLTTGIISPESYARNSG